MVDSAMKILRSAYRFITGLYSPDYLPSLVYLLERERYSIRRYLKAYWTVSDLYSFVGKRPTTSSRNRALVYFVVLGSLFQALVGVTVMVIGSLYDIGGSTPIGAALVISYPVVWAHMLAVVYAMHKLLWILLNPKVSGKIFVSRILESQVVRLRKAHKMTFVAVVGSVGKTSTKLAVAHILEPSRRVIYQSGNYNDRVTVPLVVFGRNLPNLFNVLAWLKIFIANERTIRGERYYDIAVLELGTDHPGDIAQFAYLKPDITVVTAVTPEHMEYFNTLDAVAREELTVCDYSERVIVNADDTPEHYLKGRQVLRYGIGKESNDFYATDYKPQGVTGSNVRLHLQDKVRFKAKAEILGEQGVKIALAAAAAAQLAGLSQVEIEKGLKEVKPFAGRMQILAGIRDSTIIDDSYNASPAPVKAALDVLYDAEATQRIAILGNMNELGDYSQQAHEEIGKYCKPGKLELVVTIGPDAGRYLAPAAKAMGCEVIICDSPYAAGEAVRERLKKGGMVLVEGSQNQVFAEESIKVLLADKADAKKLVRQSDYWMGIKRKQFGKPQS